MNHSVQRWCTPRAPGRPETPQRSSIGGLPPKISIVMTDPLARRTELRRRLPFSKPASYAQQRAVALDRLVLSAASSSSRQDVDVHSIPRAVSLRHPETLKICWPRSRREEEMRR
jgi:hypothetical protein